MAHINGDMILVKLFQDLTSEEMAPENEAEIEVYANPDKIYIELEPQGPYVSLKAGESTSWEVIWKLRKLPEGLVVEAKNQALVDYVRHLVK